MWIQDRCLIRDQRIRLYVVCVSTYHGRKISFCGEDALYPKLLQSLPQVNFLLHFEAVWISVVD